jgi:WD40 repeat protein
MNQQFVKILILLTILPLTVWSKATVTNEQQRVFLESLSAPWYDSTLSAHQRAERPFFAREITNTMLLKMSWFLYPRAIFETDILTNGQASGCLFTDMGTKGGGTIHFDSTNLSELTEIINVLPPPPTNQPPKDRWLLVSASRSNQWFTSIYDRRNVPIQVERLFEITGMHLEWSLLIVDSSTNFICPATRGKSILRVAGEASTVASLGLTEAKISTIQSGQESIITNLSFGSTLLTSAAVSADGRFVAIGRLYQISLFDCILKKVIWENSTIISSADDRHNDSIPRHLAVTSDSKMLIVYLSNGTLQKWNLATGEILGFLESDPSGVEAMNASRDGRFLAAAFGNGLVRVWDMQTNGPPKAFTSSKWILSMAFSPDGSYLALSGYGDKKVFAVWDWFAGRKVLTRKNWNTSIPDDFDSIIWSPDGNFFAGSPGGQGPVIFETKTWKPLACWGQHPVSGGGQTRLAFLPDGSLLGQNDSGSLEVIDASTLKNLAANIQ